jgi:hypothetical protein
LYGSKGIFGLQIGSFGAPFRAPRSTSTRLACLLPHVKIHYLIRLSGVIPFASLSSTLFNIPSYPAIECRPVTFRAATAKNEEPPNGGTPFKVVAFLDLEPMVRPRKPIPRTPRIMTSSNDSTRDSLRQVTVMGCLCGLRSPAGI